MRDKIEISRELAEWVANKLEWDANPAMREQAEKLRAQLEAPAITHEGEPQVEAFLHSDDGYMCERWVDLRRDPTGNPRELILRDRHREYVSGLIAALRFYADRDHYSTDDGLNWDSCSGEPMNILWHESEPWFIEDGSIARAYLDKLKNKGA